MKQRSGPYRSRRKQLNVPTRLQHTVFLRAVTHTHTLTVWQCPPAPPRPHFADLSLSTGQSQWLWLRMWRIRALTSHCSCSRILGNKTQLCASVCVCVCNKVTKSRRIYRKGDEYIQTNIMAARERHQTQIVTNARSSYEPSGTERAVMWFYFILLIRGGAAGPPSVTWEGEPVSQHSPDVLLCWYNVGSQLEGDVLSKFFFFSVKIIFVFLRVRDWFKTNLW